MKISIITVCYNNKNGLERTFESIKKIKSAFSESLDFEWIIVDGGSTDGTVSYLQDKSNAIDYWISEKDTGIYNAMNKGISIANGDYYIFMNSGDIFSEELFESQLKNELEGGYGLIYGNVISVDENNNKTQIIQSKSLKKDYFVGNTLCHQSIFFSKKLFEFEKYDESFRIAADLNFIVRSLFVYNCSYKHINVPICIYESFGRSNTQYYSVTRPEIRRAVSGVFPGGEYYYDAILMRKEMDDEIVFEGLQYISRTEKLKRIVRLIISMVVLIDSLVKSFKRRFLHK